MIKKVFDPPICSECGRTLPYENMNMRKGFNSIQNRHNDVRRCINPPCLYVTDVARREEQDTDHNEQHERGVDNRGGRFNWDTKQWECK